MGRRRREPRRASHHRERRKGDLSHLVSGWHDDRVLRLRRAGSRTRRSDGPRLDRAVAGRAAATPDRAIRPRRGAHSPAPVTPGPVWSKDNATVTFIAGDHGNAHLVPVAISDGSTNVIVGGERQMAFASARAGSRIAFAAGDLGAPSDLYMTAWDGSGERRLTH